MVVMWQCLLLSLFLLGDLVTLTLTLTPVNWSSYRLHHLILAREGLRNYKEEPPAATQVLSCVSCVKIFMCVLWFLFDNVDEHCEQ